MEVDEVYKRPSGRLANHLRTITCEKGVLSRADGSASWSQEGTEVLAAVYGPTVSSARVIEQMGEEVAEGGAFEVVWRPRSGVAGPECLEAQAFIRSALAPLVPLSRFPRCSIRIVLQVVADGGSVLACAANAAVAALVDAGVPLEKMTAAVSVGILKISSVDPGSGENATTDTESKTVLIFDPDKTEEDPMRCVSVLTFLWPYHYDFTPAEDAAAAAASASAGPQERLVIAPGVLASHCRGGPVNTAFYISALDMSRVAAEYLAALSRKSLQASLRVVQKSVL